MACSGGDVLSVQAAFRGDEDDAGQAGGGLVVTAADGTLLAAGQTAPNSTYGGVGVVNIPDVSSKNSNEPTGNDDPELVSVTIPAATPAGQCVVEGTAEFFDFDDSNGEG